MRVKRTFSVEKIKELIENGYSIQKIADELNTSRPTISKFLKENNLQTKRTKRQKELQKLNSEEIAKKYKEGLNVLELEKEYNVSNSVIHRILKEQNVQMRTNSESHQKYLRNSHYFDKIDNCDKAYLLGFICADGYVTSRNELGISISSKDKDFIYWFQKQLETNKEPRLYNENKYIQLVINDKIIVNKLQEYTIIPNKSLVINIGKVIEKASLNDKQIKAFLLGYFDGDGGIYKTLVDNKYYQYSCSITGTYETCSYYKNYFNNIGFFVKRHKDDKNNYTYQIGGRNKVREGLEKIYSIKNELSFYYERKNLIFEEL